MTNTVIHGEGLSKRYRRGALQQTTLLRDHLGRRNFQLYGGVQHAYTLLDVTHELLPNGSIRKVRFRKLVFKIKQFAWEIFVQQTAPLRRALGLQSRASTR